MKRALLLAGAALALSASAVAAGPQEHPGANIRSPKYDVRLEVLPDGSLDIIETITLTVGARPMTWFERNIPSRRTDGLTKIETLMDGQAVAVLAKPDRDGDLKLRWDFSPAANRSHTFAVRYRAAHALAREIDGPRLIWTALPRRHTYPIDLAKVAVFAPAGSIATNVRVTGGEVLSATPERPGLVIAAKSLGKNGTIALDITFAPNSIVPVEPRWFINAQRQREMLPAWLAAGACLVAIGVGILIMMFIRLPKARAPEAPGVVSPASEGTVPPALVTLLLSRGQQNSGLALQSTFFRLVRDGYLVIERRGEPRKWRSATFDVSMAPGAPSSASLAPHETLLLDAIRAEGAKVDMRKLMMRLSRQQGAFRASLKKEAGAKGWLDAERDGARSGLLASGLVLMAAGLVGAMALLLVARPLGPAPIVIPGVMLLTGVMYLIVSSAMSVLSDAGLQEAARWQARLAELKDTVKRGVDGQSTRDFERWFPLAIGAGIGSRWLKLFETQLSAGGANISWLKAMGTDGAASLAVIVAVTGGSHSGGSAGGAGGGGGSSGAG